LPLFDARHQEYRRRGDVENDPSWKQLIPYIILTSNGKVYGYSRGKGQGETRLHNKYSIGFGGHINETDSVQRVLDALYRELSEELSWEGSIEPQCVGLLYDDSNSVGQVHLGVVFTVDMSGKSIKPNEPDILNLTLETSDYWRINWDSLESWSQICLVNLFR